MATTVTVEVPAELAGFVRRVLALTEELNQLALSAPDGSVFDTCETAVIKGGREIQQKMLEDAVARRIESAEKRGHRSGLVNAATSRKIAARRPGNY